MEAPTASIFERNALLRAQIRAVGAYASSVIDGERGALIAPELKSEIVGILAATESLGSFSPGPSSEAAIGRARSATGRLEAAANEIRSCVEDLDEGPDAYRVAQRIHEVVREAEAEGVLPPPIVITDLQGRRVEIPPAQAAMVAELTGSEARLDLAYGKHTTGRVVSADETIALQDAGRGHYVVHEQSSLDRPLRAGETVGIQGRHVLEIDANLDMNPEHDFGSAGLSFDHSQTSDEA